MVSHLPLPRGGSVIFQRLRHRLRQCLLNCYKEVPDGRLQQGCPANVGKGLKSTAAIYLERRGPSAQTAQKAGGIAIGGLSAAFEAQVIFEEAQQLVESMRFPKAQNLHMD